jgi:thiol-disulfide isomerase/thioredoxin
VKLAPDGSYRISGVPAGEYDFSIKIYAKPSGCLVDPMAQVVVPVTVTPADVERGQLSFPPIAVPVEPVPAVGDSPELNFTRLDGSAGSLTQSNGKFTVVHFWASWCGICKHQLPGLKEVHERFAPRGLTFLGVTLDTDVAAWQAALERIAVPWPQARLAAASAAGVSSVPTYWLLDPKGKLVAKIYDTEELSKALAELVK